MDDSIVGKVMTARVSPLAGELAPSSILIDVQKLVESYYDENPDPFVKAERVKFGTSGHRGSSFDKTFNESHILAISQALCLFRKHHKITGPLFLGFDTHALSKLAFMTTLEVFAANSIEVLIANQSEFTPTPVISHAILTYNQNRSTELADGVVLTPSHDPPHHGGFKYNPPNGGPADLKITDWIEKKANEFLENGLKDVIRVPFEQALHASSTHQYDFLNSYVNDLHNVLDMDIISDSKIHIGVDPLGGAGVHYWDKIAERYRLNLTLVNQTIDPTFSFMTVDWDGQIRMDPSSAYAMEKLIALKNRFDIAFACDTDYDRHGIVTRSQGLLPSNHYLSAAIFYLFKNRPLWNPSTAIGKTVVSSEMIDRVAKKLNRKLYEVPVGFKWFVEGLLEGSLGFCGEESAGASFSRLDGRVWSTDKDGMISALLSAEMTARLDNDPGDVYQILEEELGKCFYKRTDAKATLAQRELLKDLSKESISVSNLAGEPIQKILTTAPGNGAPIGGLKMSTESGWFAARPSGTEDIYRIYAESFKNDHHLSTIISEAQKITDNLFNINKEET